MNQALRHVSILIEGFAVPDASKSGDEIVPQSELATPDGPSRL